MRKWLIAFLVVVVLVVLVGGSFFEKSYGENTGDEVISEYSVGCFEVDFGGDSRVLSLQEGTIVREFAIYNKCKVKASYAINLHVNEDYAMHDELVRVSLNDGESLVLHDLVTDDGGYQLIVDDALALESVNYKLVINSEYDGDERFGAVVISTQPVVDVDPIFPYATDVVYESDEVSSDDGGVRYIGRNPSNYVIFNDEIWRIIGVFDVASSEGGEEHSRIKLIRDEGIGLYSWDSSRSNKVILESGEEGFSEENIAVNNGYGVNEWSQADINGVLNGAYMYGKRAVCYVGPGNVESDEVCDFLEEGFSETAKVMVGDAVWNLGTMSNTWSEDDSNREETVVDMYNYERSDATGKQCELDFEFCSDMVERTTSWVGKVGLMYPSDYGYATSGSDEISRDVCINTPLYRWNEISDCYENSWLYKDVDWQWTMSAVPYLADASNVLGINPNGRVNDYYASSAGLVRPVVFLVPSVKITGGDGSLVRPYVLGL